MRKVPLKNYIILLFISVITVLVVFYLRNLYLDKKGYENNNNATMSFLKVLRKYEFDSFITENRDFILYVSDADDASIKEYEEELKNKIIDADYTSNMVYLNIDENNLSLFDKYLLNVEPIKYLPCLVAVKDGKITNVYYSLDSQFDVNSSIMFIDANLDDAK